MNPSELRNKSMTGLIWFASERGSTHVITLAAFMVLARFLAPVDFGRFAIAASFLAFLELFVASGVVEAIIQRKSLEAQHLNSAFWFSLAIGSCLFGLSLGSLRLVVWIFKEPILSEIIPVLSIVLIVNAFGAIPGAVLRRQLKFRSLAIADFCGNSCGGILAVVLAIYGFGIWSLAVQYIAGRFITVILFWLSSDWRPQSRFSLQHLKPLLEFGIHIVGTRLMSFLDHKSAHLLIGYFLGANALGYYSLATKILLTVTNLSIQMTGTVALSVFPRIQDELSRLRSLYSMATGQVCLIVAPVCFGIAVVAPELIQFFFGEKWLGSTRTLQFLMVVTVFRAATSFNSPVLISLGKPAWQFRLGLLQTFTGIICILTVVHLGIEAVAAAYFVIYGLVTPLSFYAVNLTMRIDWKPFLKNLLIPLLLSLIMALTILILKPIFLEQQPVVIRLFSFVCIGVLTYSLMILVFARTHFRQSIILLRDVQKTILG